MEVLSAFKYHVHYIVTKLGLILKVRLVLLVVSFLPNPIKILEDEF